MTQTTALKPLDEVKLALQQLAPQFAKVLPKHITEERFIRIAVTALSNNPGLLEASRVSLYSSFMQCAQDGLLPDNKEAAIVMFKSAAKYMPMVAGILKKVRNSGELATITSQIVRENDQFRYWVDADGEHLTHEPLMFGERGNPIGVYALAKMRDGNVYIEVMTKDQVGAIRDISKASDGPWKGAFEGEMWRKSAIRRLSKRLPMSTDLEEVIQRDDDMYDVDKPAATDTPVIGGHGPRRLHSLIKPDPNEVVAVDAVQARGESEEVPL